MLWRSSIANAMWSGRLMEDNANEDNENEEQDNVHIEECMVDENEEGYDVNEIAMD